MRCRCGRSSARRPRCAERTGRDPHLEIMIPLVDYEAELERMRDLVEEAAEATSALRSPSAR